MNQTHTIVRFDWFDWCKFCIWYFKYFLKTSMQKLTKWYCFYFIECGWFCRCVSLPSRADKTWMEGRTTLSTHFAESHQHLRHVFPGKIFNVFVPGISTEWPRMPQPIFFEIARKLIFHVPHHESSWFLISSCQMLLGYFPCIRSRGGNHRILGRRFPPPPVEWD